MGSSASIQKRPVFVVNGSRYELKLCDLQTEHDIATLSFHSSVDALNRHSADVTAVAKSRTSVQGIVISVGEEIEVPKSFKCLSISLRDAENTQVLENWPISDGNPMSVIVTEEGRVKFGFADKLVPDWKWVSICGDKLDEHTNHRPRKSFVANASGRKITVSGKAEGSGFFSIPPVQPGEAATIEYENIEISCGDVNFLVKTKPLTSVVVLPDNYKVTGQLHGENIEEEKWKVDGKNYKPRTWWETAEMSLKLVDSASKMIGPLSWMLSSVFRGSN